VSSPMSPSGEIGPSVFYRSAIVSQDWHKVYVRLSMDSMILHGLRESRSSNCSTRRERPILAKKFRSGLGPASVYLSPCSRV
jgi:hypothetical protein